MSKGLVPKVTADEHDGDDALGPASAASANQAAAFWLPALLPARDFEQPIIGRSLLPIAQGMAFGATSS